MKVIKTIKLQQNIPCCTKTKTTDTIIRIKNKVRARYIRANSQPYSIPQEGYATINN